MNETFYMKNVCLDIVKPTTVLKVLGLSTQQVWKMPIKPMSPIRIRHICLSVVFYMHVLLNNIRSCYIFC
jgi:hypothetical protein